MEVTLARTAGFCMGVKRAIELALDASQKYKMPIYTYGPLIHNPHVLEMLRKKGIHEISDPCTLQSGVLIIRAHGISPDKRAHLESLGLILIDATCPRVNRIHVKIRQYLKKGYSIIVFGDPNHAEVIGLMGAAGEKGYLVSSRADVDSLPQDAGPWLIVAQTTQSSQAYERIIEDIRSRWSTAESLDTLCATTDERQLEVLELADHHDAVIVVGGKGSANTIRLANLVKEKDVPVYHVETEEELPQTFPPFIKKIAVTAGASTPNWMIERVVDYLETFLEPQTFSNKVLMSVKLITESNTLVALGSISLALTCSYYLDGRLSLLPILIAGAYVFSMHILNHFADRESVAINEPLREEVYQRHQTTLIMVGITAGFLALLASALLGLMPFLLVSLATVTGGVYSFPVVPRLLVKFLKFRRIKDIPASKDIVVALAWSSVTALLPYLSSQDGTVTTGHLISVWFFAFVLVYIRCLLLDLKDIQGDRLLGRETLPLLLGEKMALTIVKFLWLSIPVSLALSVILGMAPPSFLLQTFSPLPILFVTFGYKRGKLTRRYYTQAVLDTSFILSGIITVLVILNS